MALANLDEIYRDDAILDHRRNPRNPARLADADIIADGVNPFCGDEIHLQIRLDAGGRAVAVGFQGEGCSINQAAGSMLSEAVKGRTPPEMLALADEFRRMLQSPNPPASETLASLGDDLASLSKVREFPVRIKCALLAWSTLEDGVEGRMV